MGKGLQRPPLNVQAFVAAVKLNDPRERGRCRLCEFQGRSRRADPQCLGCCEGCYIWLSRHYPSALGYLPAAKPGVRPGVRCDVDLDALVAFVKENDPAARGLCRLHAFHGEERAAKNAHAGLCGSCYMMFYRNNKRALMLLPGGKQGRPRKRAA